MKSQKAIPVMVDHPERGRSPLWVSPSVEYLVYTDVWIPDDTHPLGGRCGTTYRYRRVNLRKDEIPRSMPRRPLYEFSKECP